MAEARGGAGAPAFIFGKRNKNFRPQTEGADAPSAAQRVAGIDDLRQAFEARHGREATPAELQDAYRKKLMKQVRGRTLVKLMRANGGKPPSQAEFKAAVNAWMDNHLDAAMEAVNEELGTAGSGIKRGEFSGEGDTQVERREGRERFRTATEEASEYLARARKALAELPADVLTAWYSKAETLPSPEANAAREEALTASLRKFFERQRAAVASALREHGDHIATKPRDVRRWWNQKKWDDELESILKPYESKLAAETYAKVASEMGSKGYGASKATLAETLPELTSSLGTRITGINENTRESVYKQIVEGIRYGEGPAQIADKLEDAGIFGEYRSELVARTETMNALNDAALGSYSEYGVEQVQAVDGDGDEVCAKRDGKIFPIAEARNISDHPNGTLSWSPVLPSAVAQPTVGKLPQFTELPREESLRVLDYLPKTENLSAAEQAALENYQGFRYRHINQYLRGTSTEDETFLKQIAGNVDEIDRIIADSPAFRSDFISYRGVGERFGRMELKQGDVFTDPGFLSTSLDASEARAFADNAFGAGRSFLRILNRVGQHGRYLGEAEHELLLPRGSQFRVIRISEETMNGKRYTVYEVEVL